MSWPRPPLRLLILIGVVLASAGCPEDKSATVPPAATPPVAPTTATPPAIDWSRAFELRNRGNAYLENGELESASTDLNELCRLLPQEPLGFRNRTIASLLALEGINKVSASAAFAEALSMAKADLAALRTVEPSAPTTHLLAARLEAADGAIATAAAELRQALESNPEDASTWFELFELTRYETSPDQTQMARDALAKAHQFAPQNLFVLIEYLQLQAAQQEASIQQTFEQARVTLEPLADGIARRVRVNPLDLLDQAEQAQTQGDWRAVERSTRIIANVTRPDDAAQSDRQRIDRHPLEFMLTEWQATEVPNEATATSPVVPESPFAFSSGGEAVSLPVIDGVRDAFFADFGIDGRDEYWVIAEDGVQVFHRDSDGDNAWSQLAAVAVSGEYVRAIAVDLDQDVVESPPPVDAPEGQLPSVNHTADLDLILFGPGGIAVLKNVAAEEARRLEPVDINPELGALRDVRQLIAVDVNSDGDLDLVTVSPDGPAWWSNRGNFEFAPAPPLGGAPANVTAITAVDLDRDVDLDLVVGLETGAIGYFENLRHGTFRYREIGGNAAALKDAVVSLEVADIDGNVSWDIVAAAETGVALYSSRWIEPGEVQFEPPALAGDQSQAGFLIADLNNSGRLDLASWSADSFRVASAVDKRLTSLPGEEISGPFAGNQDRVATCDFDGDGDLDLLGVGGGQTVLLVNDAAAKGSWLEIGLLAQQVKGTQSAVSGRVNHYGLGSLVEIRTGAQYQSRVVRGARTHFGLGDTQQPNAVRIVWTNGIPDNVIAPAPRQYLCERQALKGSCPYLYAWNGERFGFVTDLLWGAPIGLVDPRGQLVPCREWEYLLIPGAALSPRDGEYQLSLTEELWEAAYFDQVELIAVDHPADVAVFTNEKVGPPSIAEPRLYTVRERRHPVRAEDQHGRDLLSRISQPDEVYATPFRHRRTQGFTEESTLELDLGLEARPGKVMLFLTGWLYPTDTSINAALEEQSLLTGPQPPSIQVPNATGGWREVEPFIGFPGGKTKTIAVPLSGDLFADNDYRIRLVTSMELAWDEIFFTVDETPAETREQVLPLVGAELQFRGFSDPIQHNDLGPERYDYSQVSTEPRWPPMRGWFTRYGDVTELLAAADDRSAVLGSGDEVIVRFAVPHDPPPSGWRRDFVLHNVGWDKDADLHTVYGQTVEPLPFRNMTRYPYEPNQSFPEDPDMQDYLRTYQTRTFDNRWFARFGTMQRKQ